MDKFNEKRRFREDDAKMSNNQQIRIEQVFQQLNSIADRISNEGKEAGRIAEVLEDAEETGISNQTEQEMIDAFESLEASTEAFKNQVKLLIKFISGLEPQEVN